MEGQEWHWVKRFRCAKGHVIDGPPAWVFGQKRTLYCPCCFLELIERECGGLVELEERNCAKGSNERRE